MPYIKKTFKKREVYQLYYFSKLKDAIVFGEKWKAVDCKNNSIGLQNRDYLIIYN
jgi:hypothetical protein